MAPKCRLEDLKIKGSQVEATLQIRGTDFTEKRPERKFSSSLLPHISPCPYSRVSRDDPKPKILHPCRSLAFFELRLGPWAYWFSDFVFLGFFKPVGTHFSLRLEVQSPKLQALKSKGLGFKSGTSGWKRSSSRLLVWQLPAVPSSYSQKSNNKACQSDPTGFPQTVCWVWFGPCSLNPTL